MRRLLSCLLPLAVLVAFPRPSVAGDPAAGGSKAVLCAACHGIDGNGLNDDDIENPAAWYASQPPKQRRSCARHVLEFVTRWPDVGPAGASLPVTVMIGME